MSEESAVEYSLEEKNALAMATFGSIALVASAGGGLLSKAKEGYAGLRTVGKRAEWLISAMQGAEVGSGIAVDSEVLEPQVMAAIPEAVRIVGAKDPERLDSYRATLLHAVREAASSSHGVSEAEAGVIAKVEQALAAAG